MKIRAGFVTNSSSTNFLIISKKELDEKYLKGKLGFGKNTKFGDLSSDLVYSIINGTKRGPKQEGIENIDYDAVLKLFGEDAALRYERLAGKGFHTYIGYTNSDDDCLSAHMTVDSFVINKKDFYMYGEHCIW